MTPRFTNDLIGGAGPAERENRRTLEVDVLKERSAAAATELARRLRSNELLVGTVLSFPDPSLAELAAGPFDFVWIDLEHGALSLGDMQRVAIGVQAAGCAAFVRLPRFDSEGLPAILDAGIDGVVAPRIESRVEAQALVKSLCYPPEGWRGFGPRRAGFYARQKYSPTVQLKVACLVQIETVAGLDAVEEIAAVDGIDALVVGCADLSFALGTPLNPFSAEMIAAIRRVQEAASEAHIASGIAVSADPKAIARLTNGKSSLVVYSADVRIFSQAMDGAVEAIRKEWQPLTGSPTEEETVKQEGRS